MSEMKKNETNEVIRKKKKLVCPMVENNPGKA